MTVAQEVLEIFKSMRMAERNSADAYAGPGKSFPLFSSGAHLHAAWMLAGHAADPDAVRARIKSFAARHGLTHMLPEDAFDEDSAGPRSGPDKSGRRDAPARKASGVASYIDGNDHGEDDGVSRFVGHPPRATTRAGRLLELAYEQAEASLGDDGRRAVIDFAQREGLSHHLSERAHAYMHEHGIPHGHPGDEHDGMPTLHEHPIHKAVNVVVKSAKIEKAFDGPEDGTAIIEGWTSTEDADSERDVVPPECFTGALGEYMARKGPLSSEHDTKGYPIGHAQRVALVRDGQVFKSATHPDDPAEFEHFPKSGTGMYGRYLITDPQAAAAVKAGNIGGFSWIGNLRAYTPLPGGGRRFVTVDPLRENTIAAYPINGKATLTAVKAFEADLVAAAAQGDKERMDDKLDALLRGAAEAVEREERERQQRAAASVGSVSKADLEGLLSAFKKDLLEAVDQKVEKAATLEREAGAGRRGVQEAQEPRESDPAAYIIKKAHEVYTSKDAEAELSQEDKELAWGITLFGMGSDMSY